MCGPAIRVRVGWVVQSGGIDLVDVRGGHLATLRYPEAAVWDFLVKGYARERCATLLAGITGIDFSRALSAVEQCRSEWEARGYIEVG